MSGNSKGRDTVYYGLVAGDCDIELRADGVRFRVDGVEFESPMQGRHAIRNILAGSAVARLFGIRASLTTRDAVRSLAPGKMRGERFTRNGIDIINDCYNSNPDAARGMLDVLRDIPARGRIAVLGEMLELGRWAEPLHREVGDYAARCGVTVLVGIRGDARFLVESAVKRWPVQRRRVFFRRPRAGRPSSAFNRARRGCHTVQRLTRHARREGPGEVPRIRPPSMLYWLLYQHLFLGYAKEYPILARFACSATSRSGRRLRA